jgi:Na+:H+ antiporter, NhaA family
VADTFAVGVSETPSGPEGRASDEGVATVDRGVTKVGCGGSRFRLAMMAKQESGGRALREFLRTEASSGILLLVAAGAAVVWANLAGSSYVSVWSHQLAVGPAGAGITLDIRHWVNEAVMTVFFLAVGLEIKRELVDGELRDRRVAALPIWAAIGGMAVPAIIYTLINLGQPSVRGWAIPMATDIAMAVGVMALLGNNVSNALKVFLLALAIVDDIGSVVVIAVFYGKGISFNWLGAALIAVGSILVLRSVHIRSIWFYAAAGLLLWYFLFRSGIHPTLAGVACGLLVPASFIERLERRIVPLSSYLAVPLFALANAGVVIALSGVRNTVSSKTGLGVMAGLVVGKPIGIVLFSWLAVKFGGARLPDLSRWREVAGVAALGGMGFTVSLFIADLAFADARTTEHARLAIMLATLCSGLLGAMLLKKSRNPSAPG